MEATSNGPAANCSVWRSRPWAEEPVRQKYEVHGTLKGPSGRRADLVTVWIILKGDTDPQFVTAFPGEEP